jgi:pimeloyl-ACP methyl ester carboxylesterase/subtilisin-like proprotein convertase family protein
VLVFTAVAHAQDQNLSDSELRSAESKSSLGSSPFTPPESSDTTFVVDQAPGLDTGCSFRSEGPLIFEIEIDRFIGDKSKLLANGLLGKTAELRMPVFDVDFTGGGGINNPERDRVTFNGNVVPGEFLQGQNDTWIPNNFNIPIDWLKFPQDPGTGTPVPAKNVIRIDIDVANTREVWCTAVDWAALTIEVPRPILTVHGIFSNSGTWEQGNFNWKQKIEGLGIPYASISMHQGLSLGLDSIADNAGDIAAKVNELKARWGVQRLNIVAHSKGGLDSRHFAESNDSIEKIIQIGTPNGGSPLADAAQKGALRLLTKTLPGTVIYIGSLLAAPAGVQLTTYYMSVYNFAHGANPKTEYTSLAGDYRFGGLGLWDAATSAFYDGRNDLIVPVWSVHRLNYARHLTHESTGGDHSARHTSQTNALSVYNKVESLIKVKGKPTPNLIVASAVEQGQPISQTFTFADTMTQGQVQRHTLFVDDVDSLAVTLNHSTGDLDLVLISPSGVRIDPAVAGANPNMEFGEIDGGLGLLLENYSIRSPESGQWTLEVTGATINNTAGKESYILSAFFTGTSIEMESTLDQTGYHRNDPVIIRATLTNTGTAIVSANVSAVIAYPDQHTVTVALIDDGTGEDTTANDGIYTGVFTDTAQSGLYRILVNADKAATPTLALVSQSTSSFSGTFNDFGNDTNGDGLFEDLVITVGLNASVTTNYRIYGELFDNKGALITTAFAEGVLNAGNPTAELHFNGEQIFQHGVNGPYTLHVVRLAEDDGFAVLPLDELENAYTTKAYNYTQFQNAAIAIPGTGSDRGVDTNGNGLFDLLEIDLNVFVKTAGNYQWSMRLADPNGTELGVAVGSGALTAGANTVKLQFDGRVIGRNGVDGPYVVSDVLIFSSVDSAAIFQAYATQPYNFKQFERVIAPDLVVQEIIATENQIQVVIKNQGTDPVPPEHDFWVDVYINPKTPPTAVNQVWDFVGDEGLVWGVVAPAVPLQPGQTVTLTIGDGYYWPTLSKFSGAIPIGTPIYAQVDSANANTTYGGVLESHEMEGGTYNNILGPVLSKGVGGAGENNVRFYLPMIVRAGSASTVNSAGTPSTQSTGSEEILPTRP